MSDFNPGLRRDSTLVFYFAFYFLTQTIKEEMLKDFKFQRASLSLSSINTPLSKMSLDRTSNAASATERIGSS